VTPEFQPVVGAEQTVRSSDLVRQRLNPDLADPCFLFTQVDFRKRSHRTYRQYLRGKYGDRVMRSLIRTSTAVADTQSDGSTAFDHDPRSRGARDYANATDELLRRMSVGEPGGARAGDPVQRRLDGSGIGHLRKVGS
jgi:chromosome partitioning protein